MPARFLRALLISGRNAAYLLLALQAVRVIGGLLPAYALPVIGVAAGLALYGWIRVREAHGNEVGPVGVLALFLILGLAVTDVRSLVDQAGFQIRYGYVIRGDEALFAGQVPTVWLQSRLFASGWVGPIEVSLVAVYMSYFASPLVAAVVLWHLNPRDLRLYLVAIFIGTAVGMVFFTLLPTAPPWLAGEAGRLDGVTRIVPVVIEKLTPGAYQRGYHAVGVNDVASFPSFHMSETLIVLFAMTRLQPALKRASVVYAASMALALVYLGEHYVVDIIAGVALAGVAWALALKLTPKLFGVVDIADAPTALDEEVRAA